jgi:hypothetical protein
MKKSHYTYYSYEEFGRGYIGVRSCDCEPEEDVDYFGSYTDKTFEPTQKIILQTYETREEANEDEVILHEFYQVDVNSHFANQAKQTSEKFYVAPEQARENGRKYWKSLTLQERSEIMKKRWGHITPEQKSENARKAAQKKTSEERSEIAKKHHRNKTPEQRSEVGRKRHLAMTADQKSGIVRKLKSHKWQCTETGFITNPGSLSMYQKARGIDTTNRVRIS